MNAFDYLKIDCMRCRIQLVVALCLIIVFSFFFNSPEKGVGFGCGYAFFMSVIFAGQPFNMESKTESGFINMLPGSRRQQVIGRFMFALIGVVVAAIIACGVLISINVRGFEIPEYAVALNVGIAGVTLILISIQLLLLYSVGKGMSQQLISLIQIVPSLLLFFGVTSLGRYIEGHKAIDFIWVMEHKMIVSGVVFAIGVFAIIIVFSIAIKIVQKRDYA